MEYWLLYECSGGVILSGFTDVDWAGRALQVFSSALDWELFPSSAGSINHGIKLC